MKKIILTVTWLFAAIIGWSQNVAINSDGSLPHASAILDIKSTDKGLLIPRVNLISESDISTIANPRLSLLLYNTNAALTDGEGFYFWNGTLWSKLATRSNLANLAWNTGGNAGTNANIDFIGTADDRPLVFKTNNILSGKIDPVPNNVFFGRAAGEAVTSGTNNSFFGHQAGNATTTGNTNTALGAKALFSNTIGGANTAIGFNSLSSNSTGDNNVAIGNGALNENKTGSNNVAGGYNTLFNNTSGSHNVAIGNQVLYSNISGSGNIGNGDHTLYNNTNGLDNFAAGDYAMFSNTNGTSNIAIGSTALFSNTTGFGNQAYGGYALYHNTTGWENIAIGYDALFSNTSGDYNVSTGAKALHYNTTGYENVANGYNTLYSNTTGNSNTATGYEALKENTTGTTNAALGGLASLNNTTGSSNTGVGYLALRYNTTGSFNTAIGKSADVLTASLSNATAIGSNSIVSTSNTMSFGDGQVDRWAFGISTTNANHALEVGINGNDGNGAYLTQGGTWTNTSDINKKEDFSALDGALLLQKINTLSIQRWKYKSTGEYHIGPTAQQFHALFAVGTDDKGISTVDPAGIALAAIQELVKQNEAMQQRIIALEKAINMKK